MSAYRLLAPIRNRFGFSAPAPRCCATSARYGCTSATVRSPPDGFSPTRARPSASLAMAVSIASAALRLAWRVVLPVLVLRKSAPSASAIRLARVIKVVSPLAPSSPDSRITFSVSPSHARRTLRSTAATAASSPACSARHGSTTSTSCAPACTISSVSRTARSTSVLPSGKLATAATPMCAGNCDRANAASRGQTHTAATGPICARARSHRRAMSASVSASLRLVRSRQASDRRAASVGVMVVMPAAVWKGWRPADHPPCRPRPAPAPACARG